MPLAAKPSLQLLLNHLAGIEFVLFGVDDKEGKAGGVRAGGLRAGAGGLRAGAGGLRAGGLRAGAGGAQHLLLTWKQNYCKHDHMILFILSNR